MFSFGKDWTSDVGEVVWSVKVWELQAASKKISTSKR